MTQSRLRLRITRRVSGSIDGMQLARFRVGTVYEVGTTMGSYLLAIGAATPVSDEALLSFLPTELLSLHSSSAKPLPPATAAHRDAPPAKPRRKKRTR